MRLEYDMYGLLFVTTLHSEYLYALIKAKKEDDAAKRKQKKDLKRIVAEEKDSNKPAAWLEKFDYGKGAKNLDQKTLNYLLLEKKAFEAKIKVIKKEMKAMAEAEE